MVRRNRVAAVLVAASSVIVPGTAVPPRSAGSGGPRELGESEPAVPSLERSADAIAAASASGEPVLAAAVATYPDAVVHGIDLMVQAGAVGYSHYRAEPTGRFQRRCGPSARIK